MGAPQFFGRVVARGAALDAPCAIVEHDTPRPLPAHDHLHAYFCLLARGGYEEAAGRRIAYQPGTVVFHPAALHHRDTITAGRTRLVIVELASDGLDLLSDLRSSAARDVARCQAPAGILMSALEARLTSGRPDDGDDLALELLGTLAGLRDDRLPEPWLAEAAALMTDESHHPLRVRDIAIRVGVHPVRLARAVRRHYRCSVAEHLHTLRIERACHLLRITDTPLIDLAAHLGYADQSHFTRVFSSRLGISPARFRVAVR